MTAWIAGRTATRSVCTITLVATVALGAGVPMQARAAESSALFAERAVATTEISQQNLVFHPFEVVVGVGDTVVWTNNETDETIHSVVQRGGSEINSPDMAAGEVFEWTFTDEGTYDILCRFHPDMFMTVDVTAAGKGKKGSKKAAKKAAREKSSEEHDFSAHNDPGSEPAPPPGPADSTIPGISGLPFVPDREIRPIPARNRR